jgi:hypothetical protein
MLGTGLEARLMANDNMEEPDDRSLIFLLEAKWDTVVEDGLVPDSHAIIVHVIGACLRVKPRLDGAVTRSVGIMVTAIS